MSECFIVSEFEISAYYNGPPADAILKTVMGV